MNFLMGPALLFCPADRPERYQKAAERADAVIVDLEDAVAPADKQRARGAILAQLGATGDVPELDPSRTIVRITRPARRSSRRTCTASNTPPTGTSCWPRPKAQPSSRSLRATA